MKWKNIGRAALATGMSLAIGLGAIACGRDYSVAYVYAVSATNATVSAFAVDYQSGALTQITGSPFEGTGRNPIDVVAGPSGKFIYVISHDDSNITTYAVGTDGKLYGQPQVSLTATGGGVLGGSYPVSAAVDPTGNYLYVVFTCLPGEPCPTGSIPSTTHGGIAIFSINNNSGSSTYGQLTGPLVVNGEPFVPTGFNPVGITISNATTNGVSGKVYVYVVDQEASPNATILGFLQDPSTGSLSTLPGTTCTLSTVLCTGYHAGVTPSAIAVEPTTRFVYVTDETSNQILGYQIGNSITSPATSGALTPLVSSPYTTGAFPINLTIDPRGKYVFTANYNAQSVGSLTINAADGSLGGVAQTGNASVSTGPTCVTVEPALGIYLYTSNQLDGSISGEKIDANTGTLSGLANTPYTAAPLLSCIVAVASGNHAQAVDNP